MEIIRTSCTQGDGLTDWLGWLEKRKKAQPAKAESLA
jgi:hypothetical protein